MRRLASKIHLRAMAWKISEKSADSSNYDSPNGVDCDSDMTFSARIEIKTEDRL
jgi:hypothetical protein